MTDREKALQIVVTNKEVYMMYAAGGDAGELTHQALLEFFGEGTVYIVETHPLLAGKQPKVDAAFIEGLSDEVHKFLEDRALEADEHTKKLMYHFGERLHAQGLIAGQEYEEVDIEYCLQVRTITDPEGEDCPEQVIGWQSCLDYIKAQGYKITKQRREAEDG